MNSQTLSDTIAYINADETGFFGCTATQSGVIEIDDVRVEQGLQDEDTVRIVRNNLLEEGVVTDWNSDGELEIIDRR